MQQVLRPRPRGQTFDHVPAREDAGTPLNEAQRQIM